MKNPKLAHTWSLKTLIAEYKALGGQQVFGLGSSRTVVLSAFKALREQKAAATV